MTIHPRRAARALALAAALALGACQGVPLGHYRYRAAQEPAELGLGLLALPFAAAGDMLLSWLVMADPFSWTEYALSLISPFHNAIDAGDPEEVQGLASSVAVTRSRRSGDLQGDDDALLARARELLTQDGWTLAPPEDEDEPWRLATAWRAEGPPSPPRTQARGATPATPRPLALRRLLVTVFPPEERGAPVHVRVRLEVGGSVHGLVPDAPFAEDEARLAALEAEADEAEDDLEDEQGNLVSYYSHGERGKEAAQDELEARRDPHRRRMERARDGVLELEDRIYRARAQATREELLRRGEDPLPGLWARLVADFPERP